MHEESAEGSAEQCGLSVGHSLSLSGEEQGSDGEHAAEPAGFRPHIGR